MTKTLQNLQLQFAEEIGDIIHCLESGSSEFSDESWQQAKQMAVEEFRDNFNDYNDWVFEDDYNSIEEWESAKRGCCETGIREFIN